MAISVADLTVPITMHWGIRDDRRELTLVITSPQRGLSPHEFYDQVERWLNYQRRALMEERRKYQDLLDTGKLVFLPERKPK